MNTFPSSSWTTSRILAAAARPSRRAAALPVARAFPAAAAAPAIRRPPVTAPHPARLDPLFSASGLVRFLHATWIRCMEPCADHPRLARSLGEREKIFATLCGAGIPTLRPAAIAPASHLVSIPAWLLPSHALSAAAPARSSSTPAQPSFLSCGCS